MLNKQNSTIHPIEIKLKKLLKANKFTLKQLALHVNYFMPLTNGLALTCVERIASQINLCEGHCLF